MTRILHTADWHLGARLVDHDRLPEQAAFLDWLLTRIEHLRPGLLLVAGDVFDTANPPQEALALYYRFLARLASSPARCRVLVLGGNHDSPNTLNAPREVLRALDVTIVGEALRKPDEAVLVLPEGVVCAVPFLRERDVRSATPGQDYEAVAAGIREGVRAYYAAVLESARAVAGGRPIIGTGHLTVAGSLGSESERTIHVGNLGAVGADCFAGFAYVALGHIHRPQAADAAGLVRYPGSPVTLSFSEAGVAKELRVVELGEGGVTHFAELIPVFRRLLRLTLPSTGLRESLAAAQAASGESLEPWLELTVEDGREIPDLDRVVREAAKGLCLRVLKVLVPERRGAGGGDEAAVPLALLEEMTPVDVFRERLRHEGIDLTSQAALTLEGTFTELLGSMHEDTEVAP